VNFVDPEGEAVQVVIVPAAVVIVAVVLASPPGQKAIQDLATKVITEINDYFAKKSKESAKQRATDIPSWTSSCPRKPNEGCKEYAKRILFEKYGANDIRVKLRGPGTEYSKIVKACERGGL